VVFPWVKAAPPITTISFTNEVMSGWISMASAMFVKGPSSSTVISPGLAITESMMNCGAEVATAARSEGGTSTSPSPFAPWTKSAGPR